jgi:hypothetical protein
LAAVGAAIQVPTSSTINPSNSKLSLMNSPPAMAS